MSREALDEEQLAAPAAPWSIAKLVAVVLGAPLVAFSVGCACIALAPSRLGFAFGFHLMVPLWIALACSLPLLPSGRAALFTCAGATGLASLALWLGATP